jgi:N-acetylglucosaminyl-diphospho-decaprenol L-rhamnosyltransferase
MRQGELSRDITQGRAEERPRGLERVGAVIVTHNQPDLALGCAEAVGRELERSAIAVVVNEPSSAREAELTRLQAAAGIVILNERRRGYGANLNEGARRLGDDYEYYLFLNDDAVPEDGSIATLVSSLDADPSAALAGPRVVDPRGNAVPAGFRFPTVGSEVASALILPARMQLAVRRRLGCGGVSSPRDVEWVLGAVLAVRAQPFRALGGFDESYFLYSEETDLAYRLRANGWNSRLCSEATVRHMGGASTAGGCGRELGFSRSRFIRKHWPAPRRAALAALLAVAYLWNSAYVGARIALAPKSFRDKTRLWRDHWRVRPFAGKPLARRGEKW